MGQTVFEQSKLENTALNVGHLAAGLYTIYVMQGDAVSMSRFVKL